MGVMAEARSPKKPKHHHPNGNEMETIKVHTPDGAKDCHLGCTVESVLSSSGLEGVVAARLDNEIVPLSQQIEGSQVHVEPVMLASSEGQRVLKESLKFLLAIAVHESSPKLALTISKPLGAAYFCVLSEKASGKIHVPTKGELDNLQTAMEKFVSEAEPIKYVSIARKAAIEHFASRGAELTAQALADCMEAQVQCVMCKGLYHLPRVPVVVCTSMIPRTGFSLASFEDGILVEAISADSLKLQRTDSGLPVAGTNMLYTEYMERKKWAQDVDLYSVAQLNSAIRQGRTKKVIQAVEANCDRQFVEIADKIKSRSDVKLVLIAGPSSSGKTTFAMRLQVQLEALGFKPQVVSVDSYYKAWQDITTIGPQAVDWESLDSLNLPLLNEHLIALMSGKEALIPEYDMKTSMPADKSHWTPTKLASKEKGIILMEGIHCLNPQLTNAVPRESKFNIAIAPIPALQLDDYHVLSGTSIRMLRRMVRDYLNRGRPVLTTLKQWPAVVRGEVSNIYPHQCHADAVMNSEIGYEMNVLKVHVEPLLRTVSPEEREYSEVRRLLQVLEQFIAMPAGVIPPQSLLREFVGGSWYYDFGGWYKAY